jgi:hypothetical protein
MGGHSVAFVQKQVRAAALTLMPDLICSCSVATVVCIWYIGFLPSTLFGVSCRCNFSWPERFRTGHEHVEAGSEEPGRVRGGCRQLVRPTVKAESSIAFTKTKRDCKVCMQSTRL